MEPPPPSPPPPPAQRSYATLVERYKGRVSKDSKDELGLSVFNIFQEQFNVIDNESSTADEVAVAYSNIFELKKLLDVKFAKDINCEYVFYLDTPNSYGCDLRELIYNRDGTLTTNGQKLLDLFANIATRYLSDDSKRKFQHTLTDIDDTVYANPIHGIAIAGVDKSWVPHIPYPGVKELHSQLNSSPNSSGYTTIVSAAPGAIKVRKLNSNVLKDLFGENNFGFIQGEEGKGKIFSSLGNIMTTVGKRGDDPDGAYYKGIGDIKLRRIIEYSNIFPERNFIWIGDNGQADERVGIELLKINSERYTVCIHKVRDVREPNSRIIYFDSYPGLADLLKSKGIMNDTQVNAVRNSAQEVCSIVEKTTSEQKKTHCGSTQTKGGRSKTFRRRKIHKSRIPRKSTIRNHKKNTRQHGRHRRQPRV